jgi:alanyl-tRNA synthetase
LDIHEPILYQLVDTVVEVLGDTFPEIKDKKPHAEMVIKAEEEAFGKTLDRGLEVYGGFTTEMKQSNIKVISGAQTFTLYDTYGFPVDLTQLMAQEDGFTVDIDGFNREMEVQKERARAAQKFGGDSELRVDERFSVVSEGASSEFVGYDQLECQATVRRWFLDGDQVQLTLDRTPFYAESGGQVGDQGRIEGKGFVVEVEDTQWAGDEILHLGKVVEGKVADGIDPEVTATVDWERRQAIQRNHTVTHLMQAALRKQYGVHVSQSGSLVHPDYLRFDYNQMRRATQEEMEEVERQINHWVQANIPVEYEYTTFEKAQEQGVIAIFGEKYGEDVRVVRIPGISQELCGGCHVRSTGDIGLVRIRSETAAAAGIRRIDAVTGSPAIDWTQEQSRTLDRMEDALQSHGSDIYEKLLKVLDERRVMERELETVKLQVADASMGSLLDNAQDYEGIRYITAMVSTGSMEDLKKMGDMIRDKLGSGVGILGTSLDDRPAVVCVATPDLVKDGVDVVTVAKAIGRKMGGGGGGKPHLATAGGKELAKLESVLTNVQEIFREVGFGRQASG